MSTFPQKYSTPNHQTSLLKQKQTSLPSKSPLIHSSQQIMSEFHQLLSQTNSLYEQFSSLEKQFTPSSHIPNRNNIKTNTLFYETNDISNILPNTNTKQVSHIHKDDALDDEDDDVKYSPKEEDNECESGNDSSVNLDEIANEIEDYYNGEDYRMQQMKRMKEDVRKVKNENQVLMKHNIDLRNNNKMLENEIKSYKASGLVDRNMKGEEGEREYDGNLRKFLERMKNSLSVNLEKNLYLVEQINDLIMNNMKLIEENMKLGGYYGNMVTQYEHLNKRNMNI